MGVSHKSGSSAFSMYCQMYCQPNNTAKLDRTHVQTGSCCAGSCKACGQNAQEGLVQEVMWQGCGPKQEVCDGVGCECKRQSSSCIEGCQGKVAVGAACSLIDWAIPVILGIPCSRVQPCLKDTPDQDLS